MTNIITAIMLNVIYIRRSMFMVSKYCGSSFVFSKMSEKKRTLQAHNFCQ